MPDSPRVIAVDWSGAVDGGRLIWLAEAVDGRVERLESGRSREELIRHLACEAERDPQLVVGLDFAFSLPEWYLLELGVETVRDLWRLVAEESLTTGMSRSGLRPWLADPEAPFWARARPRDLTLDRQFRRTELELREDGFAPKSVFQLVGAGQVGVASLRGMPFLRQLSDAGFGIWPFDDAESPCVVEIYPRVLTGAVTKSDRGSRERYLAERFGCAIDPLASSSEHAFDAAVSAAVMSRHAESLLALRRDPDYALEGRIWQPDAREEASRPLSRSALVQRLAEISHASWMRQAHRDKHVPLKELIQDLTDHDLERAEDTVRELEQLGIVDRLERLISPSPPQPAQFRHGPVTDTRVFPR